MKVRFGYVAISNNLKKVTSSSTVTFKYYNSLPLNKRLDKLKQVTLSNLNNLEKIIDYNIERNIHFYRMTSKLIPLSTHKEVEYLYRDIFKTELKHIGKKIKQSGMRVDTHPDQFNVINSDKEHVFLNTMDNLLHHVEIFEDLEIESKMVIHIGSKVNGKEEGIKRFINNYKRLPKKIRDKLIIENDDISYTVMETLYLCKKINVPMVVDVHHHKCNNNGENIGEYINEIFKTWEFDDLPPKIHFSSGKNGEFDRKHHDYINSDDFIQFIETIKDKTNYDFDVMIEAKEKDVAMFKLIDEIIEKTDYKWLDATTFEV